MKIHFECEATEQRVIRFLIQLSISRIDDNPIKNYCIITPKYVVAFEIKSFSINNNDNHSVTQHTYTYTHIVFIYGDNFHYNNL